MSAERQTRFGPDPSNDSVTIETDGRAIRPWVGLLTSLVDEARLNVAEDYVRVQMTDPANVELIQTSLYADGVESFDATSDDLAVGVNLERFTDRLSAARKGVSTADPVSVTLTEGSTRVEVEREYDQSTVRRTEDFLNIDADSVREDEENPDLDLGVSAEIGTQAFDETVSHLATVNDQVRFEASGSDLVLNSQESGDDDVTAETRATIQGAMEDEGVGYEAIYSLDYLTDMTAALHSAHVETVRVEWDEEFPMKLHFEREADGGVLYDGVYMLAPRVTDG